MKPCQRLKHSSRFQELYRHGTSTVHPLVVLRALPNGLEYSRFGFVAGKRIGKAVLRNRAKRRLREAVRRQVLAAPAGYDIVLIARAGIVQARFEAIDAAVGGLLTALARREAKPAASGDRSEGAG
jgi:ribonuclease P protein component